MLIIYIKYVTFDISNNNLKQRQHENNRTINRNNGHKDKFNLLYSIEFYNGDTICIYSIGFH